MNKRLRKKINKGQFWFHKGRMLWKYHAYQPNRKSKSIMVCYVDGVEIYFNSWKYAKAYVRSLKECEPLIFEDEFDPSDIPLPIEEINRDE